MFDFDSFELRLKQVSPVYFEYHAKYCRDTQKQEIHS